MKILFLANGSLAVPILEVLRAAGHSLDLVALPDPPKRKRGQGVASPVVVWARERNISLRQVPDLADPAFLASVRDRKPVAGFAVDYGKKVPKGLFLIPGGGTWNLHPSLLPRYRGAAPIQWAIANGDTETGVTLFRIVERMDAGPIADQRSAAIRPEEDAISLERRLSHVAAEMAFEALPWIADGSIRTTPQDEVQATRARKLAKEDGRIDWSESAEVIERKYRAFRPWPGIYTFWKHPKRGRIQIGVEQVREGAGEPRPSGPGEVLVEGNRICVGTGRGALEILRLRPGGKAPMDAAEFLRGYPLRSGDRWEEA